MKSLKFSTLILVISFTFVMTHFSYAEENKTQPVKDESSIPSVPEAAKIDTADEEAQYAAANDEDENLDAADDEYDAEQDELEPTDEVMDEEVQLADTLKAPSAEKVLSSEKNGNP